MSQLLSSRLASPAATVEIPACPSTRQHSANHNTSVPKLRDSCVACASSKVRCHRQKPSCSRCLKRKVTCEYVTSKRGGRNPADRSETAKASTNRLNNAKASSYSTKTARQSSQPSSPPIEWFVQSFFGTDIHDTTTSTPSTTLIDPFLGVGTSASMEGMDGLNSDLDHLLAPTPSYYTSLEQGKSINSLDAYMLGDLGHVGDLDALSMVVDGDYILPLTDPSLKSDGSMTPAVLSSISPTLVSPASSNQLFPPALIDNILHDNHDRQANDFQCGCLLYAVGLMKQFFDDQPGMTSTTSSQVHVTIARNKRVIDTIHCILRCCFAHDSYLLLMLSMILLKVLDSYADAAHTHRWSPVQRSTHGSGSVSPTGRNSKLCNYHNRGSMEEVQQSRDRSISWSQSTPTGRSDDTRRSSTESAYSARTSMHWILGELHRPQRLVNQLSELLAKQAARNSGSPATIWSCSSPGRPSSHLTGGSRDTSLFSDIVWRQLGQDLTRRLQKLPLDIIEALEKE